MDNTQMALLLNIILMLGAVMVWCMGFLYIKLSRLKDTLDEILEVLKSSKEA